MKRITSLFLLTMSMGGTIFANQVNVQTAQTVARNFITAKGVPGNADIQLTNTYTAKGETQSSIYVFSVNSGKGFVIVSGDDGAQPILGYSTENSFPVTITNNEVNYWMNGYNKQISHIINKNIAATPEIAAAWEKLKRGTKENVASKPTGVTPFLTTTWDQWNGGGNTLYNNLCPTNTPTGCVATAMAQIMYFWKHPTQGTGSNSYNTSDVGGTLSANFGAATYDWNNMPAQLTNSSTTAQKDAIALLMFHCGVAVNMNYNTAENEGSGAYVNSSPILGVPNCSKYAYTTYFGYATDIQGLNKSDFTDATWLNKLKIELDNTRPILYTGRALVGGHAFIFDGYDDDNKFHVNWGWSGMANGYYAVGLLNPTSLGVGGGDGNFNEDQGALINIHPAATSGINDVLDASLLGVYPNPVKDMMNIDLSRFEGKVTSIELFNIQGQKVSTMEQISGMKLFMPTNQLADGFYFLHLQSDKGVLNKKIIIQH